MNGFHETRKLEKPFPGCLGRMVNLFDLSTNVSGSRLLTDRPHRDGSPVSRSRSDAARMRPIGDPLEDKAIVSELSSSSSNKSSIGTPIKMLIAHEMSREIDSKHNSPSLVAKLMGLDTLPMQEPDSTVLQRSQSRCHWREEDGLEMPMQREIHQCLEQTKYKDVYEVWHQSHKGSYERNKSPKKGRHSENTNEKKMALVREKFIEAKRLATDEKLRHSKRFQDALEVLSSNKDLFLKFLQESNSLFSQHQFDLQSVPPSETKRITVLRPSKLLESKKLFGSQEKNEKQTTKASDTGQVVGWDRSNPGFSPPNWRFVDIPTQPTRIVVLKPSPGKLQDIKAVVSPPSLSPRVLHTEEFCEDPEDDNAEKSREVATEITRQMRENLSRHRRDDTLLSSVFSNGYIGDESSFHKSENDYAVGDVSDSEVASPTSRHSWDYINRAGSPCSSSSFGHASYFPESSVCREARKRLSERWAMMASNGNCVEQPKHVRRSSSTLGEMLALSDPQSSVRCEEGIFKEQEARGSTSCLTDDLKKNENVENSPRNLLRSRSVPISSTILGEGLNLEVSNIEIGRPDAPKEKDKEVAKPRSIKLSLKGKVSSLFFSKSKKSGKEKSSASQSRDESERSSGTPMLLPGRTSDAANLCANGTGERERSFPTLQSSSNRPSLQNSSGMEHGVVLPESGFSERKPVWSGNPYENQDQPSPISVLEHLFEEDDNITSVPCKTKRDSNGVMQPCNSLKSNLIDKSPPIGSIARTLSLENSHVDTTPTYALQPSSVPNGTVEGEREWLFYVQSLLAAVGLDHEAQPNSFVARWHSPDTPLDPSLRERYIDLNEKEITHEGKRRQRRSTRKLVFDCVNEVLVDITGYASDTSMRAVPNDGVHERMLGVDSFTLVDRVWAQMKEWFSFEVGCDEGDSNSLVVETVVRREVVGKGWAEHMRLEMDNVGKEIEGKLLEELVHEAVVEWAGRL